MQGLGQGRAPAAPVDALERPRRRPGHEKDAIRRRLLFTSDLLCVLITIGIATLLEGSSDPLWGLVALPGWVLIAKLEGLYDSDHPKIWHRTSDEAASVFHWITLSAAGTLFYIRALPDVTITVEAALAIWAVPLVLAFPMRSGARALWRRLQPTERALVLGEGELADQVTRKLVLEPGHHLSVMEHGPPTDGADPLSVHDLSRQDLEFLIEEAGVERIVLAAAELDEETLARVVAACRRTGVKLSVVPPMRAMLGTAVQLTHIGEMPVIEYGTWESSASTAAIKRAIDVIVSATLLVVTAPLIVLIAIAVKLDSRGPAFFKQLRAGRDGRPFRILKFRTMFADAEERIGEVVPMDQLAEPMYKLRDDPRVTRLGRLLRRTSLDELPQLVNVLLGDMSLVGPRPEEVWLVERYGETERFRLEMRPGITGPMQVHGRGDLSFQERLALEREYVENYSLKKDVQILMRTVSAIVQAKGAY